MAKTRTSSLRNRRQLKTAVAATADDDKDGIFMVLLSCFKIFVCFAIVLITAVAWGLIMVLLLPWPYMRIRLGNLYGHIIGGLVIWLYGIPIEIQGSEHTKKRAIYISNHASPIDAFFVMWLAPIGTVGVAKKEVIWYPLLGQLYTLAHHIRIDRSNPAAAIQSMKEAVRVITEKNLSLIMFPEGTRSGDGRLLPFKKGFVHLALQSHLPIVPMILTGTHLAWRKGTFRVRPVPITVKYLPPINTDDWTVDKIDDYVKMIHDIYVRNLPASQKPLGSTNRSK
uniref:1-acyl-sn-glycerol-3-phosphate acyltransferase n=1 Tax=Limnanthes alba TaxID=42439 RepID=PLSC_LIMAL|nr:RecName: Full=1-acyl-sn-glycerol-3-phosphate acyltransferase; Short=1-AGP acyltransferase; Short=1-AGPAT; AltName: Full=Lysophosphatidic acid acyltransferase; Short=LPAAT [Limnanthes alba]AAC49185.1 lysophosphatidic acid acyltransferase [Limnanthes alba]